MAFGDGLERIARVSWSDRVSNVHSAAVPPWLVQSDDEYMQCNERPSVDATLSAAPGRSERQDALQALTTSAGSRTRSEPVARSSIKRLGQQDTAQKAADASWLPNFGGVWQDGPRSKTKHEFQQTQPLRPVPSALSMRPTSVYQRRRKVTSAVAPAVPVSVDSAPRPAAQPPQADKEPPPRPDQPAQQKTTTTLTPATETPTVTAPMVRRERERARLKCVRRATDSRSLTPSLACGRSRAQDAKKQLLLAQKERLRAKMAAKRGR